MPNHTVVKLLILLVSLATEIGINGAAHALTFNFTAASETSAEAINGFNTAGNLWSSLFIDNVTVNINIGYQPLGSRTLAQASSIQGLTSYTNIRSVLSADITSVDDTTAFSNLQSNPALNLLFNYTSDNPNGSGSSTPYLDNDGDANNTNIRLTTANAKALGLLSSNNPNTDASITFNSDFTFDFDRSDGISAEAFDFIGIAAHEIGHTLGFISGVDVLDNNSPRSDTFLPDNAFTFVSTLDLYRYSTDSVALGSGVLDWTADTRVKYFSLDGGVTPTASFSTGVIHGDGRQASHWKDNLGLGIMDPTTAPGEVLQISNNDIRAFDVIGYNRATPVPFEFSPGVGILLLGAWSAIAQLKSKVKKHKFFRSKFFHN